MNPYEARQDAQRPEYGRLSDAPAGPGEREHHPLAALFPLMEGRAFSDFKADIAQHGLAEPIVTYEGKVLDGRNRLRACIETGTQPVFREWEGSDPLTFIISANLQRRHLDESQRAMVATKLATLPRGRHASIDASSQSDVGEMLSVSRESIQPARKVKDSGASELVTAVEQGEVAVSAAADISALPKKDQRRVMNKVKQGAKPAKALRAIRCEAKHKPKFIRPLPDDIFNCIYADPPWQYRDGTTDPTRTIENQYETLSLDEIKALPVPGIAAKDCILFLWSTAPLLAESLEVVTAWGFQYKTCAIWDKELMGMGHYFRVQHELLLIATRGSPGTPYESLRQPSVYREKRGGHSVKPEWFRKTISTYYPSSRRTDLFARESADGWVPWGDQVEQYLKLARGVRP